VEPRTLEVKGTDFRVKGGSFSFDIDIAVVAKQIKAGKLTDSSLDSINITVQTERLFGIPITFEGSVKPE